MSVAYIGVGVAAAGIVGSVVSSGNAADAQQEATNASIAAQQQSQDKALAAQQPFLSAGYAATNKLQDLLGISTNTGQAGYGSLNTPFQFDSSQLGSDPGFKFQQQQGQAALDRRQAAGGNFYSGQGLQAAATFNQGLASTSFNDAYNRQNNAFQTNRANTLNPLQALAGQGQSSANITSGTITSGSNALSSLLTNNANAQGAAGIAGANSLTSGINNGVSAWQRQTALNKLLENNNSSYGSSGTFGGGFGGGYGSSGDLTFAGLYGS